MPLFDAVTISFGSAGTGGFGVTTRLGSTPTAPLQWIIAVFMMLFGVNSNLYFLLSKKEGAFKMEEVRWYLGVIVACSRS